MHEFRYLVNTFVPPRAAILTGASVLVVDDDPTLLSCVARVLKDARASVFTAADGDQAIEIARTTAIALLLTDVEMPGLDGFAVARAVKAIQPRVGIVFMSGRCRDDHLGDGRLAAADILVDKPFGADALVGTLVCVLGSVMSANK